MNPWPQPYYGALEVLIPSKQRKSLSLKTSANVRTQKNPRLIEIRFKSPTRNFSIGVRWKSVASRKGRK